MSVRMVPVESSNVAAVGYDPAAGELHVAFKSGSTTIFAKVTPDEHSALLTAESIGKTIHKKFKGRENGLTAAPTRDPKSQPPSGTVLEVLGDPAARRWNVTYRAALTNMTGTFAIGAESMMAAIKQAQEFLGKREGGPYRIEYAVPERR